MLSIQLLIVLMIISALIAVEAKSLYGAVIALGVLGLELALTFLLLRAPDLAAVLLVLEMLALAALLKTASKRKASVFKDFDLLPTLTFGAFTALFVMVFIRALSELPAFGSPLMSLADEYSARAINDTGATNVVASIALNFRAFDTVVIITLIFLAAMGIAHVLKGKE